MTANQIAYWNLQETKRTNRAREVLQADQQAETHRSNVSNEEIKRTSNAINQQNVDETKRANVARETETARSNRAQEYETHRSNIARELETQRSNLANEALKSQTNQETERSNRANEQIKSQSNRETVRHNVQTEHIDMFKAAEAQRHNYATEQVESAKASESQRHNRAVEAETWKSNMLGRVQKSDELFIKQQEADTKQDDVDRKYLELGYDTRFKQIELNQQGVRLGIEQQKQDTYKQSVNNQFILGSLGLAKEAATGIGKYAFINK